MGGQRGSASVEFTLIVPILVLLVGLVVGGARVWFARASVDHMAAAAARAGSLARTPAAAEADARALARAQAATEGLRCGRLVVDVDADDLSRPPGQPARVEARVTCGVPLADVLVPGWPGELVVVAEAMSVVDTYRGRQ